MGEAVVAIWAVMTIILFWRWYRRGRHMEFSIAFTIWLVVTLMAALVLNVWFVKLMNQLADKL